MKKFNDHQTAMKYHLKNINKAKEELLPKLASEFTKNTNQKYVPIKTGRLRESALEKSKIEKNKAIIIWQTPYARRRFYEGSITGVAYWTWYGVEDFKNRAKQLIKKELKGMK